MIDERITKADINDRSRNTPAYTITDKGITKTYIHAR